MRIASIFAIPQLKRPIPNRDFAHTAPLALEVMMRSNAERTT